jgi:transcriptional regulator with XRE-family HTH domain
MKGHRVKNPHLAYHLARTGLTGQSLAAAAGLHPGTVSHLLNRRSEPKPATAQRIAGALGVTHTDIGFLAPSGCELGASGAEGRGS